ncbi:hypothetical protein BaRGS_00008637 [Batillaria attramentaria]|uniref:Uncharacterized protein n=1 Tax=Batillaria attramentaria TaxID=370345 RepID=A0ABD0LKS4_9CAEN
MVELAKLLGNQDRAEFRVSTFNWTKLTVFASQVNRDHCGNPPSSGNVCRFLTNPRKALVNQGALPLEYMEYWERDILRETSDGQCTAECG